MHLLKWNTTGFGFILYTIQSTYEMRKKQKLTAYDYVQVRVKDLIT